MTHPREEAEREEKHKIIEKKRADLSLGQAQAVGQWRILEQVNRETQD